MALIRLLEYPQVHLSVSDLPELLRTAANGNALPPGHYAYAEEQEDGSILLVRDPLGCNKLFFGRTPRGDVVAANRIARALELGVPVEGLISCPPGRVVRLGGSTVTTVGGEDISDRLPGSDFDEDTFRGAVSRTLDQTFQVIRRRFPGARFVVCLSGGLDSSVIAARAVRHLDRVTAVCFSFISEQDLRTVASSAGADFAEMTGLSDDFRSARLVARALSLPFQPVFRPRQAVAAAMPSAVRLAQDWRDFNVHCAVVNLFLAQDIRTQFPGEQCVVLTGDLMNEFVCDYREEVVDGTRYYPQPRVSLGRRRKYFVRGLDAGDREIGVFNAFGLTVCQPFAAVAGAFMMVPPDRLAAPDLKAKLNGPLLPDEVQNCVSRDKTRAQIGGPDKGVLGICHELGLDQAALQRLWLAGLPPAARHLAVDLIQFGRYRTTASSNSVLPPDRV